MIFSFGTASSTRFCWAAPPELSYKIRYMTQAVASLPDYQSGVLDLTFQEDRKAVFTPW